MAPHQQGGGGGGGGKRKRPDRNFSHDEGQGRPSPHRPESMNLAQQNQRQHHDGPRNDGRRRVGRGNSNNTNNNNNSVPHASGPASTPTIARVNASFVSGISTAAAAAAAAAAPSPAGQATATTTTTTAAVAPSDKEASSQAPPPPAAPSAHLPTPAHQLQPPRAQSPPREPRMPYAYEYLTDQVISKWQESGKQSVVRAFAAAAATDDKEPTASALIQELIRSTVDDRIPADQSGAALHEILQQQPNDNDRQELQSLVADTINVLDERDWKRSSLRTFIAVAQVSPSVLREELDVETLQALGLVRHTFSTMRNRKTTNLIYRQANFNLLREESEGYSKLITEYFNVSHVDNLSDPVAEDAFQRIKALVGSFDLDVGRVLDITLDLMANLLVKNFRFFVKFLRASSWWPEDNIPEGIEWTGQDFASLPNWALPASGAWNHSAEERDRLTALKHTRDAAFWKSLKETGMKAYFQLGARKITNLDSPAVADLLKTELQAELNARGQDTNIVRRNRINNARKWMRETGCLPPLGNPDAAQILGFKLAFYASDARNKKDDMPDNLIWMSALLIKIGFISLRDLYPHLHPPDDNMGDVKVKLQQEKEAREKSSRPGGSTTNALAMAGALADDTAPNPTVRALRDAEKGGAKSPKPDAAAAAAAAAADASNPEDELPEPANQKIMLLKSLLLIGALPEALFILGKFPWMAELVHDLPDYIHRLLHHMLTKVYEPTRPLADREGLADPKPHIGDPAGLPKGLLKFTPAKRPKSLRWANLERGDIGDETEYKFYWEDWADNIPMCQNVDDVFAMCNSILNYSGVKIGRDSALLMKLTRIGKKSLTDDQSESNKTRWTDLCKRLLVPALSLTKHNTGDVNEMFELLKMFPMPVRYSIYAEWHFGATSRNPDIVSAFKATQAETRDVLKRISKTNVRAMGKALSKVAFSSPGVVMQVAIHQMESYDNLIDVVVECVRYFSMLGYDVLVWCLMTALGGGGRNRVQADGMLTSAWLRALSNFAGAIFKRYSAIDPSPILQYVTNELRNGNSTDLEILEQIITGMAGIRSDVTFNETQVLAMAGGKVLQAQTLISVADERHKMDKTSKRLIKALTEPGLAGQLLISIAQEKQMYPNHDVARYAPLKVLGNNVDKINEVFIQYLDTLRSNLAPRDFDAVVPDIVSLITDFGLEPPIAFAIGRSSFATAIAEYDATKDAEMQQERARKAAEGRLPVTNGDVSMTDADEKSAASEADATPSKTEPRDRPLSSGDSEMKDAKDIVQANGIPTSTPTPAPEPIVETGVAFWHPVFSPVIEKLQDVLGRDFGTTVNIPFYVTFWALSLEDILVNSASYEQELTAQNHLLNQITNDRSDLGIKAVKERDVKKKAIVELKDRLTQEMREQIKTYQRVRGRLVKEKAHWFSNLTGHRDQIYNTLWQKCFLPRLLLSPLDASYTLTMIKFLHNNGTPDFRTMWLYDHLFHKNQLAAILYQCTAREAENLGRFLSDLLKDLASWHAKQETYEKNAYGVKKNLPGFAKGQLNADGTPANLLSYEDYRRLLFKWHATLNLTFQLCFESGEYMHIRNAIVVLRAVFQTFPAITFMGTKMVSLVEKIGKEDNRGDLKLAAMSLLGNLKRMEKTWIMPQAFHLSNVKLVQKDASASLSRSGTPVAGASTLLNPAASDFKPVAVEAAAAQTIDDSTRSEDGEIDEEKRETPVNDDREDSTSKTKEDASLSKTGEDSSVERTDGPKAAGYTNPSAPTSRPSSTAPTGRTPHALPSRPDIRPSAPRSDSGRPTDRGRQPRHEGRDRSQAPQDFGRLEPPAESRTPNSHSRDASPGRRSRARTPERDHSRDYQAGPSRHDERGPPRVPSSQDPRTGERDRGYGPPPSHREAVPPMHQGRPDSRSFTNGTASMLPPSQPETRYGRSDRASQPPRAGPLPLHGPSSNSGSQPGTPSGVNPERFALISGDVPPVADGRRSRDEPRRDRDERRDRGSRPQSPRRVESVPPRSEPKEERRAPLDPNPFASQVEQRGRIEEPGRPEPGGGHAPTGPRSARHASRNELGPKPRDLFETGPPTRRPVDTSHGRLNPDDRPPQDSTYGRLSQAPDNTPSGPRGNFSAPSGQGGRTFTPTGPGVGNSSRPPPPPSPTTLPAQSSSTRGPPQQGYGDRNSRSQYDRPQQQQQQLQQQQRGPSPPQMVPTPAPEPAPVGIHPSRLKHLPLEVQTSVIPPSGPRSAAPTGPATPTAVNSPANRIPSGPSAGDRRKFAGLNDTLANNGSNGVDKGASIRGRASRQGSMMAAPSPTFGGAPTGPGGPPTPSTRTPLPPQQMPMVQQPYQQAMHPSRMEGAQSSAPDARSGRRDEDRGSDGRHRSSRDQGGNDERSRHGQSHGQSHNQSHNQPHNQSYNQGHDQPHNQTHNQPHNQAHVPRYDQSQPHSHGPTEDYNRDTRQRNPRIDGRTDGRDRPDGRRSGREPLPPAIPPQSQFSQHGEYPLASGRGYDNGSRGPPSQYQGSGRSAGGAGGVGGAGGGGEDYSRRDNNHAGRGSGGGGGRGGGGAGSGNGADERRDDGWNNGGAGAGGAGGASAGTAGGPGGNRDRKRRGGEEMGEGGRDREQRGDKRRRSGA